MTRIQKISLIASAVLSLLIIGGALLLAGTRHQAVVPTVQPQRPVSKAELSRSDGKDGRTCLVAVDGTVYKIQDFALWQNGQHTPSGGLAYCGADLSNVIDQAPHGRSILSQLIKVGPLRPAS